MKKYISIVIFIAVTTFSSSSFAWGFKGHVLVAQIAYENMSAQTKNEVNGLSSLIFDKLSNRQGERLNRYYQGVSTYAKIAVLPDTWRRWKLKTIFHHFGAKIPESLESLQYKRTGMWHFINQPFPDKSCKTIKSQNVVWALQKVRYAFEHAKNKNAKAVLLVMLTHWTGDINQPLHTISHVDDQCKGDKGGNLFCLTKNQGGYCRNNLHHLWDYGVGYLSGRKNLIKEATRLQNRYPKSVFKSTLITSQPDQWVKQEYSYAPFIYSTGENQKPSSRYYQQGQQIAQRQIVLAGYRLAYILNKMGEK